MVATLLKLKLLLVKNSLKRQTWTMVLFILGAIGCLGIIPLVAAGTIALSFADQDVAWLVLVLSGSVLILGWALLPLLLFGSDETLDPSRFTTLDVPHRQLTQGLLLSGFIGLPGITTGICVLAPALTWWRSPIAVVAAVVMAPVGALTCFALSRLLTTISSNALRSRRGRDLMAIVAFVAILGVSQVFVLISGLSQVNGIGDVVRRCADVLAWTPLGAPWAAPADLAGGDYLTGFARLAIAIGTLVLLVALWSWSLRRAMLTPSRSSSMGGSHTKNSMAQWTSMPWVNDSNARTWAVAARCLRYWRSDPRYLVSAASFLFLPIIFIALTFFTPDYPGFILLGVAPFLGLIVGWGLHNDIGSDSTAFWLHVSTDVPGRADRAGRVIALSLWAVPALVTVTVILCAIGGRLDYAVTSIGVALGLYLAAVAVSTVASATLTYPVARPGDSPMKSRPGAAGPSMVVQMATSAVSILLALPVLGATALVILTDRPQWGWLVLLVGAVLGSAEVVYGIRRGGAVLDGRAVKLLAQVVKADA